jgi:hypothetical protein
MIKENELRIGNLLNHNNGSMVGSFIVGLIHLEDIIKDNSHAREYEPIPLTEEWLLRFGFIKHVNQSIWYTLNKVDVWFFDGKYVNDIDVEIKYVNQLQNLYWCLTGEELKLDQNEVR